MLTAPEGMGARGQESLLELARTQHLALPKGDVAEVVASRAALMAPEGFQLSVIDKAPLLHQPSIAVRLYCSRSEGIGNGFRFPL